MKRDFIAYRLILDLSSAPRHLHAVVIFYLAQAVDGDFTNINVNEVGRFRYQTQLADAADIALGETTFLSPVPEHDRRRFAAWYSRRILVDANAYSFNECAKTMSKIVRKVDKLVEDNRLHDPNRDELQTLFSALALTKWRRIAWQAKPDGSLTPYALPVGDAEAEFDLLWIDPTL